MDVQGAIGGGRDRKIAELVPEQVRVDHALQHIEALAGLDLAVVLERLVPGQEMGEVAAARTDLQHRPHIGLEADDLLVEGQRRDHGGEWDARIAPGQMRHLEFHGADQGIRQTVGLGGGEASKLRHEPLASELHPSAERMMRGAAGRRADWNRSRDAPFYTSRGCSHGICATSQRALQPNGDDDDSEGIRFGGVARGTLRGPGQCVAGPGAAGLNRGGGRRAGAASSRRLQREGRRVRS